LSYEQDIAADVERIGWSAVSIADVSPSFVYSVGLMFSLGHPELIVFGLADEGYDVLRAMVEDIRGGRSFAEPGASEGVLAQGSIRRPSGSSVAARVVPRVRHGLLSRTRSHWRTRSRSSLLARPRRSLPFRAAV
jgi:hypothetical protein